MHVGIQQQDTADILLNKSKANVILSHKINVNRSHMKKAVGVWTKMII